MCLIKTTWRRPSFTTISSFWAASGCIFVLFLGVASFAGDLKPVEFNIKAGDLATALDQFARQSGQQIFAATEVTRNKYSPAIRGAYEPHQALKMLPRTSRIMAR
jgi:hypothetical protein